jgi:hypothetical protein
MLKLTGEQSTGRRAIKASSSFAAFAPALVLQAIVRPDEADCVPAHQFPTGECASHEFPACRRQ